MKKNFSILLVLLLMLGITGCSSSKTTVSGTYAIDIEAFDWGCGVTKTIVKLEEKVDNVDATDFKVLETKQTTDWEDKKTPVIESTNERTLIEAYSSDKKGNKIEEESEYFVIKMKADPNEGSPLLYTVATNYNTWSDPYYLTFELTDKADITANGKKVSNLDVDKEYTKKTTSADLFEIETFTSFDKVNLKYGLYQPADKVDTLFVWLHGTGEAGIENTDPHVTALANKVTNLAGEGFQKTLGATSVLVPQCPTIWQDSDGKGQKWGEDGLPLSTEPSYYQDSLFQLIEETKAKTGASKVVVGGCSGGGYMTLKMILEYPEYFSAAIPICEAVPNEIISDTQLEKIKDLPIYFVYSQDDPSVDPKIFSEKIISRLKTIGASNLHVFAVDHVVDTFGLYNDLNEGKPYQYNGHWSWIYFLNNQANCNECNVDVWSWIASSIK